MASVARSGSPSRDVRTASTLRSPVGDHGAVGGVEVEGVAVAGRPSATSGRSCVATGRIGLGVDEAQARGPSRSVHSATRRSVEVSSSRPHRWRPNHAVSTSGCRPSGPGRAAGSPAARWGFGGSSPDRHLAAGDGRATDVRRGGPGARARAGSAASRPGRPRPATTGDAATPAVQAGDAAADVDAVLHPPAHARARRAAPRRRPGRPVPRPARAAGAHRPARPPGDSR